MDDEKPRWGLWLVLSLLAIVALWVGRSGCESAADAVNVVTDGLTGKQAFELKDGVETQLRGIVDQRAEQFDETRRR
ncbi:MAG: hypothetical protein AB7O52_01145 [Planctomycetota bacterium]